MTTISRELADWVVSLKYDDIPYNVIESAKTAFLDVVGIALASSGMEFGRDAVALAHDPGTGGKASVLGFDLRLPAPNDALAHGLDYDDTHAESVIHTSACVVPAALGAAEADGADGRALSDDRVGEALAVLRGLESVPDLSGLMSLCRPA